MHFYKPHPGRIGAWFAAVLLSTTALLPSLPVCAAESDTDYAAQQEERLALPIQSNEIASWPEGPSVGAEGAIVLESGTGTILYAKNIDEKLYPASTTKLLTCLIAARECSLDEIVTFSYEAVSSIEAGSSNIGIDAGQSMTMEECLYGILTASANEVAAAVAEHIAGSQEAFAEMMNETAAELGCTGSHFVNPHGLFDENHYTTPHDLALIAEAFFQNEQLSRFANTASHHFAATDTQPDDFTVRNKHQLITGDIAYEGIRGGKTGYTDEARQTLVTCAEQNGMKLICVVMKEESPSQFTDTVKLLDYGFRNFSAVNVLENEDRYNMNEADYFHTSSDLFGNSEPILTLNENSYLILPVGVDFDDLTSEISYDVTGENEVAEIRYYFSNTYVGTAAVTCTDAALSAAARADRSASEADSENSSVIFVNVVYVLLCIVGAAALLILVIVVRAMIRDYNFHDIHL